MNLVEKLIQLDRESPKRVLVVGDGMTDVYVHGRLEQTCQEGCPKFVAEGRQVEVPGGADNAAHTLICWKTHTTYMGPPRGSVKTRFMVGDRCVFRHDDDNCRYDTDLVRSEALERLWSTRLPHAVLLSDYDKGLLTEEFVQKAVHACRNHHIPCVADCKRAPEFYAGCILKCNSDYQHKHNQQLGDLVYDQDRGQRLVVTGGAMNPITWDEAGPVGLGYDLPSVKCVNHVGAGDCFAAHLTLALAYGFSLKEAAAVAHSAGRVYVQHPHNRPPRPEEIAADMSSAK